MVYLLGGFLLFWLALSALRAFATADPAALADLRARLRATRWPDAPQDAGWSLGTDLSYLRELVAYWTDEFDWPAQEAALARLPRFRAPLSCATAGRTRSGATRRSSRC